jgi:hypothetical protein
VQGAVDFAATARRAHVIVNESVGHRNFSPRPRPVQAGEDR